MLRWIVVIMLALVAGAVAQSIQIGVNGQVCFVDTGRVICGDPGLTYVKGNSGTTSGLTSAGTVTAVNTTTTATMKATNLTTDSSLTTATVCVVQASGQFFFGSGSAGVCAGNSSLRFKHDIAPVAYGLDDLLKLRPVVFNYREGYGDSGARRQVGLIAEDVAQVMPGLVQSDVQGRPNSVDYMALVPILVRAVQELKENNDQLRSELRQREARR